MSFQFESKRKRLLSAWMSSNGSFQIYLVGGKFATDEIIAKSQQRNIYQNGVERSDVGIHL